MPQTITPTPAWPSKLQTIADGDTITGAAFLAAAQQYADALATLRDGNLATLFSLGSTATHGIVPASEYIYTLNGADSYYTSKAVQSPNTWSGSVALPGGLTLSAPVPAASIFAANALEYGCFLSGTKSYRIGSGTSGAAAGKTLARITTPGDVLYVPGGGGVVVAIGTDGGGACRIDVSTDVATTWAASTSGEPAADTNWGGVGRLACDGASTVVAVPTATATGSTSIWYSKDAGLTWTEKSHGGGNIRFSGVGYDSQRGYFVALERDAAIAYTATDPAGTWTPVAEPASFTGWRANTAFTCIGGTWVASSAQFPLLWSHDLRTTHGRVSAPPGAGTIDATYIYRCGGRLGIVGSSLSYLTGRLF